MTDSEQLKAIDEQYVLEQYKDKIGYYKGASISNKNAYKRVRTWSIILGSLVTLFLHFLPLNLSSLMIGFALALRSQPRSLQRH